MMLRATRVIGRVLREPPRALASLPCHAHTHTHTHAAEPRMDFGDSNWVFRHKTSRELMRGLVVLYACAFDPLVANSHKLMTFGQRMLGERGLSWLLAPFYKQFVGGDTEEELGEVSRRLAAVGVRLMVAPMLETDVDEAHDADTLYTFNLNKTLQLVNHSRKQSVLGGARPLCQTKITAHLTADILTRVSETYQSLNFNDKVRVVATVAELLAEAESETGKARPPQRDVLHPLPLQPCDVRQLLACLPRLYQLGAACVEDDVVLAVDAEYVSTNPAIRLLSLALMVVFNRSDPIIWNTYQGYLKAGVETLKEDLAVMEALGGGVSFGAKIVRGAYMDRERRWAAAHGLKDPVNDTYEDTNSVYTRMVEVMLQEVASSPHTRAMIVATHNEASVVHATAMMRRLGLDPQAGNVVFGQVYGMAENISVPLAAAGFLVYKSVPCGTLTEVLPYLSRRASENRAVLQGARRERQLLTRELLARLKLRT